MRQEPSMCWPIANTTGPARGSTRNLRGRRGRTREGGCRTGDNDARLSTPPIRSPLIRTPPGPRGDGGSGGRPNHSAGYSTSSLQRDPRVADHPRQRRSTSPGRGDQPVLGPGMCVRCGELGLRYLAGPGRPAGARSGEQFRRITATQSVVSTESVREKPQGRGTNRRTRARQCAGREFWCGRTRASLSSTDVAAPDGIRHPVCEACHWFGRESSPAVRLVRRLQRRDAGPRRGGRHLVGQGR